MLKINLVRVLTDLDEAAVLEGVKERLDAEVPVKEILNQLQQGVEQVGKRYAAGDYFLSEFIVSAEVFTSATALIDCFYISRCKPETIGTIILGTVKDDIHDIGKNIVSAILSCNGVNVVDLGVDIPIATFVEAVKVNNPQVVGLCCLLTTAFDAMRETVAAIKAEHPAIKILVGGGSVDEKLAKLCGADGYCKNAYAAVEAVMKAVEGDSHKGDCM